MLCEVLNRRMCGNVALAHGLCVLIGPARTVARGKHASKICAALSVCGYVPVFDLKSAQEHGGRDGGAKYE